MLVRLPGSPPPTQPPFFMCIGRERHESGKLIAVITDVHPQRSSGPVTVLNVGLFVTEEEARDWFNECCVTQPWQKRS